MDHLICFNFFCRCLHFVIMVACYDKYFLMECQQQFFFFYCLGFSSSPNLPNFFTRYFSCPKNRMDFIGCWVRNRKIYGEAETACPQEWSHMYTDAPVFGVIKLHAQGAHDVYAASHQHGCNVMTSVYSPGRHRMQGMQLYLNVLSVDIFFSFRLNLFLQLYRKVNRKLLKLSLL